eukprot:TRINITY_DN88240_c0_g1_i1.p1 TRINITY_DN88240_c0_g1~~TRINITY_DN88240_c0_g1_i1.p1  ORF type:complete len:751 (-),score=113.42 TRINITY_DN88240_c0_g1_i1:5803-8055(-)
MSVKNRKQLKETPLFLACKLGDEFMVQKLLEKGADYKAKDYCGRSCKQIAERNRHFRILELLYKWKLYKSAINTKSQQILTQENIYITSIERIMEEEQSKSVSTEHMEGRPSVHLPEISKEAFEKEGFDDIQFIKTQLNVNLSFVPDKQLILSYIVQQLQKHQESCHKSIVELLQSKKGDLLSFSQKLDKIRRHISILEELYESLFSKVKGQSIKLAAEFAGMRNEISELRKIRKEQHRINIVLSLHGLLKSAKAEFNKISGAKNKEEICVDVAARLKKIKKDLELAMEDTGDSEKTESIIAKNIRNEVDLLGKKLLDILIELLMGVDFQNIEQDEKQLYNLLQAFQSLKQQTKVYEWIRQKCLSPLSSQLIDKIQEGKSEYLVKMKSALKEGGQEPDPPLKEYYNGIRGFLYTPLLKTLTGLTVPKFALAKTMGTLRYFVEGYDFALHAIWEQIQNDLIFKQSSMFSSAIPKAMQANYGLTLTFLQDLLLMSNEHLMSHGLVKRFLARFEFKPYFQVYYMEVSKKVESLLGNSTEVVNFDKLVAPIIQDLFGGSMYIKEIGTKFLGLAMQILNRYVVHLQKASSVAIGKTSAESCYKLIEEIMIAHNFVRTEFIKLTLDKLKVSREEANDRMRKVIEQLADDLVQKLEKLLIPYVETLKYDVTTTVMQNTDSLKSVVSMYRMTGKAFANQPSPFAISIFRPLVNLLGQTTFQRIPKVISYKSAFTQNRNTKKAQQAKWQNWDLRKLRNY